MQESPDQELIKYVRRLSKGAAREIISAQEFTSAVFNQVANIEHVYPDIIPELWDLVPGLMRSEFIAAIRGATMPDFRWYPFYISGFQRLTEEERRRNADIGTVRIRAWAVEFVRFLDRVTI